MHFNPFVFCAGSRQEKDHKNRVKKRRTKTTVEFHNQCVLLTMFIGTSTLPFVLPNRPASSDIPPRPRSCHRPDRT